MSHGNYLCLMSAWSVWENHVDSSEGGDAQYDWQGAEDEARGAGSSGGPGLGCAQRVSGRHDLHWDVSCSKLSKVLSCIHKRSLDLHIAFQFPFSCLIVHTTDIYVSFFVFL